MHTFASIGVLLSVATVCLFGSHWSRGKQGMRQHALIADDGRPRWIALEPCKIVLARLGVEVSRFRYRLSLVGFFVLVLWHTACRLPFAVRCLFGRGCVPGCYGVC